MSDDDQEHARENKADDIAAGLIEYRHINVLCTIYEVRIINAERINYTMRIIVFNSNGIGSELLFPVKQ